MEQDEIEALYLAYRQKTSALEDRKSAYYQKKKDLEREKEESFAIYRQEDEELHEMMQMFGPSQVSSQLQIEMRMFIEEDQKELSRREAELEEEFRKLQILEKETEDAFENRRLLITKGEQKNHE